jgi:hypothetical protein
MRAPAVSWVAVLAVLGAAAPAPADPLVVTDFQSLGAFPTAPGTYTVNTSGTPTLTGPGGVQITGVASGGIAVFTFDSIAVGDGLTLTGVGDRPLALLSYGDVAVSGTGVVDVGGRTGPGGPGAGAGGVGMSAGGGPGGGLGGGSGGGIFLHGDSVSRGSG